MILKEDKLFIINGQLKSLDAQKIMLNDKITSELNQEDSGYWVRKNKNRRRRIK